VNNIGQEEMESPHFNDSTYEIRDLVTGEIVPVTLMVEEIKKTYWEKAFINVLASFIEVGGEANNKVLAYLIRERNNENMILGTFKSIAAGAKVSEGTVSKLFKILQKKEFLKKIRNGLYMVNPKMLRYGSHNAGVAMMILWEK